MAMNGRYARLFAIQAAPYLSSTEEVAVDHRGKGAPDEAAQISVPQKFE